MNTSSNRPGSGGRSRARANKGSGDAEKKNGKKAYKAGRSFSKNKSFRETKEDKPGERPRRSPSERSEAKPFKKPFDKERSPEYRDRPKRTYGDKEEKSGSRPERGRGDNKPFGRDLYSEKPRKDYREAAEKRPARDSEERSSRESGDKKSFKKPIKSKDDKFSGFRKASGQSPHTRENSEGPKKRRFTKPRKDDTGDSGRRVKFGEFEEGKVFSKREGGEKKPKKAAPVAKQTGADGLIRLNKYLSNAGVASRRDADNLILSGVVKVNGVVVDQLGTKISPDDKVTYGDAAVRAERKVYLLLNKPKDYITTLDDPKDRKTVMELVKGACRERIYPVGRLDRNTTGLLLFTNDGELTTKLTHPKFGVKKVYHVSINKGLKAEDFKAITEGIELEDGVAKADDLAFVGEGKKEIGIEIHSGRNRIVRRIFEHLGYDVLKLDRVVFAGLTKKDLPRGKHRFLTGKEIGFLQMIG